MASCASGATRPASLAAPHAASLAAGVAATLPAAAEQPGSEELQRKLRGVSYPEGSSRRSRAAAGLVVA